MATFSNILLPPSSGTPSTALIATTTALATVGLLVLAKTSLWPARPKLLPNPLKTGANLDGLVYQQNALPGARDVDTPYGSIRVYEFGPEDGHKVLFVHGISTPCITLGPLANRLAERGCRVMLFDLFGRGFSDNPSDLPQDARLFTTQILLALASSPLSWTGTGAFRLIGYSLGGGIAVHFANAFPHMVGSLVLLAPAGLIRAESFGRASRFLFQSGLVPERLLAIATRRRLQQPIARDRVKRVSETGPESLVNEAAGVRVAAAELSSSSSNPPLERRVLEHVRWSVTHHAGFVPAFMSSIRHAPLTGEHASWGLLANREPGSTVVLLAREDEIIDVDAYTKDALPLLGGKDRVYWRVVPGGHDFVMTHTGELVLQLDEAWGL